MKIFVFPKIKISGTQSRVLSGLGVSIIVVVNVAIFFSNYNLTHSKSLSVAQQYFQHAVNEHKVDQSPFSLPAINWQTAPLRDFSSGIPITLPAAGHTIFWLLLFTILLTTVSYRFVIGEEIKNDLYSLGVLIPPPKY